MDRARMVKVGAAVAAAAAQDADGPARRDWEAALGLSGQYRPKYPGAEHRTTTLTRRSTCGTAV